MEYHFVFNLLTMNTFVPVRKIIKIVSSQRNPKHERRSSLQECSYPAVGSRRRWRWNPWLVLFILLSVTIYLYSHRALYLPAMNGPVFINEVHYDASPHEQIKFMHHGTHKKKTAASPIRKPSTANIMASTKTKTTVDFYKTDYDVIKFMHHGTHKKKTAASPIRKPSTANIMASTKTKTTVDFYKTDYDVIKSGPGLRPKLPEPDLPLCFRKRPYPKYQITLKSVNLSQENVYPLVIKGGSYHPPDCKTRFKVGIIVPYRDRERSLGTFLYNIHPFLMRQKLDYQIFVIEQEGTGLFNKGRVYNAGFSEMLKFNIFHCVVFHDVDLLPLHENIAYNCPTLPRHMCSRVNDTEIKKIEPSYKFKSLFGGVVSMTRDQFERANGFSNLYFGWGGEDNDMFWRLRAAGYPVVRYNSTIGVYLVLPHTRQQPNPFRHHLLSRAVERYKIDGLSNSEYYVVSTKFRPLCTHIVVDINPRGDNITDLNHKWDSKGFY